jgi:phosphoglycolate phosphatase-like HAD superfamily hydrolase
MEREGLRRAIASSAQPEERRRMLLRTGLADLLPTPPPSSQDQPWTPHSDTVEAALLELDLRHELRMYAQVLGRKEPRHVIMIGDTPYDVKAARAAGIAIVAFRCGGWTDGPLEGAVAIYDGPWDLVANFDASPLGRSRRRASRGRPPEAQV